MFLRGLAVASLVLSLVSMTGCTDDAEEAGLTTLNESDAGGAGGAGGARGDAGPDSGLGDTGADAAGGSGGLGGGEGDSAGPVTVPVSGAYSLGVNLVELGGFVLHLQLVIETEDRGEEGGRFTRMALSAIKDDMVSEPFVEVVDVPIRSDDTFLAVFPESALPAAFSPTGSEVRFRLNLEGEIQSTGGFCGLITGEVLTLDLPLVESTFSAEPWQSRTDPIPSSCQSDGEEGMCQRMTPEMCPELAEGMNVDFSSCEEARAFRLFLPEEHDPGQSYPLVFLWHGLGSDVDSIVRDSGLADWVTEGDFILAVPVSRAQAVEWDQLTVSDSKDLAFFDDMVTCTQTRLGVDPLRIYTTGLSGGGLFSTYLGLMRADVLAATAPMSGGLIIDYQMPSRPLPYLVTWGGEEDIAVEQDFHVFAQDLIGDLRGGGHFVGACNHGRGHEWPQDLNPAVVGFFRDHPMDVAGAPYAAALPETFPDYCSVLEGE